jgi:hypothetical protein
MCEFLQAGAPTTVLGFAEAFLLQFRDAERTVKLDKIPDFVMEAIDHILCLCRCIVAVLCPKPLYLKSSVDDVKFFFGDSEGWDSTTMLADGLSGTKVALTQNDQFMAHLGVYWGFASIDGDKWPQFGEMWRP